MNTQEVYAQVGDVPATFRRIGQPYTQWIDAEIAPLATFTDAADAIADQVVNFADAQWGWLDVWGLLLGIARDSDEADSAYMNRIDVTLEAEVGTIFAIEAWGQFYFGAATPVTEATPPTVGYSITLPAGVTQAEIDAFAVSLARIRPAGVPFNFEQQTIGMVLDTINYLDATRVVGGYLAEGSNVVALNCPSTTQNARPLLPDLYLIDPSLNPS